MRCSVISGRQPLFKKPFSIRESPVSLLISHFIRVFVLLCQTQSIRDLNLDLTQTEMNFWFCPVTLSEIIIDVSHNTFNVLKIFCNALCDLCCLSVE